MSSSYSCEYSIGKACILFVSKKESHPRTYCVTNASCWIQSWWHVRLYYTTYPYFLLSSMLTAPSLLGSAFYELENIWSFEWYCVLVFSCNAVWTSDGGKTTGNSVWRCTPSVFRVEVSWNFCCMARQGILFDSVFFSSANFSSLRCNCDQVVGVESLMTCLMLLFGTFVKLYILLHTTVQIKDDERANAWNTFASHMYLVRRRIFVWKSG